MLRPCIFCEIVAGRIAEPIVFEDADHIAFFPLEHINPGHLLVIPRRHTDYLFDMGTTDYDALWAAAARLAPGLRSVTSALRVGVVVEGFRVPHVHVHLVPLYARDELNPARAKPLDPAEAQRLRILLRDEFGPWLAPMPYSNGIAHYYDFFATVWGQTDDAARFLTDLLLPRSSVLEIGAGVGVTAAALAAAGFHVTALEPDPGMYAVMLSRLALRPDLEPTLTPIPEAAGFPLPRRFDSCVCFSVLHLLESREQVALVSYAHQATRPGGKLVLEIPVASPRRLPRPWERVAQRQFGEMRYEHHAAAEPLPDGSWHTHWKFRAMHGNQLLDETAQTFHWRPLSLKDSDDLLGSNDIGIEAEYAGFDRAPFRPNESRVRLVVGRVT